MLSRPALLAVSSVVLTTALVAAGVIYNHQRGQAAQRPMAPAGSAYADFSGLPDGPPPAMAGALRLRVLNTQSDGDIAVVDGALTHGMPRVADSAGYLECTLPHPVTRIGARAGFAKNQSGSIVLVLWQSSVVARGGYGTLPNAGLNLVVSAGSWILGLDDWDHGGQVALASGTYRGPDNPQIPRAFELSRDGADATVTLPDGQHKTVADPRIAQWSSTIAGWELYEPDQSHVPAALHAVWAS